MGLPSETRPEAIDFSLAQSPQFCDLLAAAPLKQVLSPGKTIDCASRQFVRSDDRDNKPKVRPFGDLPLRYIFNY
jgi:hypothetical protein